MDNYKPENLNHYQKLPYPLPRSFTPSTQTLNSLFLAQLHAPYTLASQRCASNLEP